MRFHSSIANIDIPCIDIPTFIFEHSKTNGGVGTNPDLAAITDKSMCLTFADLERLSNKLASGLSNKLKLKKGDMIAVILPNCALYPVVTLAVQMIGGICATINPEYNVRELAYHLEIIGAQGIVSIDKKLPGIKEALKLSGTHLQPGRILTIDGEENNISRVYSDKPFDRIRLTTEREASETVGFIVFSSGTTGMPKGVMVSHRNIIANILQSSAHMDSNRTLSGRLNASVPRKAMMCVIPLFHMLALSCLLHFGLFHGFHIVTMRRFNMEGFCALSQLHMAKFSFVAPPIVLRLAKDPVVSNYDLSSYAGLVCGATSLPKGLQSEVCDRTGIQVVQEYGSSEASGMVIRCRIGCGPTDSCGILAPNIEAKVVDDKGRELGVDGVGELCFKGPNVMLGYLNNPQATCEAIDANGFLHTGDIGYTDKEGNWFIVGRKKELIKYNGFQVAPAELEGLLGSHPAVVDSAVVPVYDESCVSEIPKAFVVVHPEHMRPGLAEEIVEWVNSRVVGYKKLRGGAEIIDEIPKSVSGKILRRILKEREAERRRQGASA